MARTFKLEIVTPEKIVFSEDIVSLVVPAERGYLGILAGHAPLLCTLQPGEITIRRETGDLYFATSGGFLEATPHTTKLLCESAESVQEIDTTRAEEALRRAKERLHAAGASIDRDRAQAALDRAQNRLNVAQKRGR
ncbi:MAG: ATP synthase F1 subunit epsilon [Planctomycetes bacterium]|nr:ATP synthase F1 subunit epsilon [Planctomycetota bacterium]